MSETANNERLDRATGWLRERARVARDSTHWDGCSSSHWQCATALVLDTIEDLRAENVALQTKYDNAVYGYDQLLRCSESRIDTLIEKSHA